MLLLEILAALVAGFLIEHAAINKLLDWVLR